MASTKRVAQPDMTVMMVVGHRLGVTQDGVDYTGHYGDFLAWFGHDEICMDYLDWLRWPDGNFICPFCHRL